MKKSISLIALALGVVLSGCSSLQTISFDQLEAADISFPPAVRKVAVVDNMPVFSKNKDPKVISPEMGGDGKIASEAFAKGLADANYFDQVIICDSALRVDDKDPEADKLLTKAEVQKLIDDLGVDLIFSFDQLHIKAKESAVFYSDYPVPVNVVSGVVTPVIRAYISTRLAPLLVVSKQDTLYWDINPSLSEEKIIKEASEYAAYLPVNHLLPHWKQVVRYYFDGGGVEMRDAGVCLRENDWNTAYELWNAAYEKKKGQQKMKAAYNIALYYEIKDDLQNAREWVDKAQKLVKPGSKEEQLLTFYSLELSTRAEKLTKLKIQMNRFDDNF